MNNSYCRHWLVFFLLIISFRAAAQKKLYYDLTEKPCKLPIARFFGNVSLTDSGWVQKMYFINSGRLRSIKVFKDSSCKIQEGHSYSFYSNGKIESIEFYSNNKKEGLNLYFHTNGQLSDSSSYHEDEKTGISLGWYSNGVMRDSSSHINDSTVVEISWFDNGNISSAGYFVNGKKKGKWKYFHRNGQLAANELNENGIVTALEYFNEDGSPQLDTSLGRREAGFKGGFTAWANHLNDYVFIPLGMQLMNTDTARLLIQFVVNEDGTITEPFMYVPFTDIIDEKYFRAVKESPPWLPQLDHNRRVKVYRRQPCTLINGY